MSPVISCTASFCTRWTSETNRSYQLSERRPHEEAGRAPLSGSDEGLFLPIDAVCMAEGILRSEVVLIPR
jgi:hypothetical protein